MTILPLDHPEPFAATLGLMLYPGEDNASQSRARAFASQYLAEPLRRFLADGGVLSYEALVQITCNSGVPLDDLKDRWWDGLTTGETLKLYFCLTNSAPDLASWGNATKLLELGAARQKVPGSRTSFYAARRRCSSVAHLWAAYCIRDRRFRAEPSVGYEFCHDFEFFLAEAEYLSQWGRSWQAPTGASGPPLSDDVWRLPDGWAPPERQPGWPRAGGIPHIGILDEDLVHLRSAGRPRKVA